MLNQIMSVALLPVRVARRLAQVPFEAARKLAGRQRGRARVEAPPAPERSAPPRVGGPPAPERPAPPSVGAPVTERPVRPPVPLVDETGPTAPRARAKTALRERPAGGRPAAKPKRAAGPTAGQVARLREAQREAEGAPEGPGPAIHVDPPWEGYDGMTAQQIIARLKEADEAVAGVVRLYEAAHKNRATVVAAAGRR